MRKKQIRIFSGEDTKFLEAEVNFFLSGLSADAIKNISMSESAFQAGHITISILYESEG